MVSASEQVKLFMEPESIAIVGVSRDTGEGSLNVLKCLLDCGYHGKLFPVNPCAGDIMGVKTFPSLGAIPEDVDLAIISTPRSTVPEIIRECGEKNIRAAIVIAQGFADAGDAEGKRLQAEMLQIARETGVRIVGPNTIGTANAYAGFHTSFVEVEMEKIPIGVVCQSGLFFGAPPALRLIGKGIDIGNGSDIDFADGMEYYENDPDIKVIVLYVEGIRDGKRFFEVAKRVAKKKPIIVLRGGKSEKAARNVQSHTGSMAGRDEVWSAAFKQCGMIQVDELEELSELAEAFSCLPLPKGRGIGILTPSGGAGSVITDLCAKYGLDVVDLSPDGMSEAHRISPSWLRVGNPLDIWPAIMISERSPGEGLGMGLELLLSEQAVDSVIFIAGAWMERVPPVFSEILEKLASQYTEKPIACWIYGGWGFGECTDDVQARIRRNQNTMPFRSPDRAIRVLSRMAEYSEFLQSIDEK